MRETLVLRYDGGEAAQGEMDAYQAAAAVVAFSDFLAISAKAGLGSEAEVRTTVRGVSRGSFTVEFSLHIAGAVATLIASEMGPETVVALLKDAFRVYKHLEGRPPEKVEPAGARTNITNDSGIVLNAQAETIHIVFSEKAGAAAEGFVRNPLMSTAESVSIERDTGDEVVRAEDNEALYFGRMDYERPLLEETTRIGLQIETVTFQEGNKWRFSDGGSSFWAEIEDADFLARIESGQERFGKGDTLIATVRIAQAHSARGKLLTQRSVLHVQENIQASHQERLNSQNVGMASPSPPQGRPWAMAGRQVR